MAIGGRGTDERMLSHTIRFSQTMRLSRQRMLCLFVLVAAFGMSSSQMSAQDKQEASSDAASKRPNIVVLFCDDLGYGDLGCYEHPHIRTPNLDRLASQGIRFTRFYSAAAVCSPSRAGLLTGRNPNRAGIYDWIPGSNGAARPDAREQVHLRRDEVTFPQKLRTAGYATFMAGKWHLNSRFNLPDLQPTPEHFGFDTWIGTNLNAQPSHAGARNFIHNGKEVGEIGQYSCLYCAEQANAWLSSHVDKHPNQPFLIYLPFHEPHEPIASPRLLVEQYSTVAKNESEAKYFANVANIDLAVGNVLKRLKELNLDDNTLVIFTSDNGPETLDRYKGAHNSYGVTNGLRGMKLHTHDGGIRVPAIVRWPSEINAGQTNDIPIWALDLFPTICEMTGLDHDQARLDGQSLLSLLRSGDTELFQRTKPLFWCFYNALNSKQVAMISGKWKVLAHIDELPHLNNLTPADLEKLNQATFSNWELFDLVADRGESNNLIESQADVAMKMKAALIEQFRDVLEDSPTWTPRARSGND